MSYYFVIVGPHDNPLFNLTFGTSKAGGDGVARFRNADVSRHMNQFITHASLDIVEEVMWMSGQMYLKHVDYHPPTNSHISAFITGNSGVKFLLLHQPTVPTHLSSSLTSSSSSPSTGYNNPAGSNYYPSSSQYSTASASSLSSSSYNAGTSTGTTTPTSSSSRPLSTTSSSSIGANPTSPQTEEAIRAFFWEVYEAWVKTVMSPFFRADGLGAGMGGAGGGGNPAGGGGGGSGGGSGLVGVAAGEVRSPVFRSRVLGAGRKYL